MALPWGGSELAQSAPSQMELLFDSVQTYMDARPRRHQPGLHPFAEPRDDEDAAARSDSGAASFLSVVRLHAGQGLAQRNAPMQSRMSGTPALLRCMTQGGLRRSSIRIRCRGS